MEINARLGSAAGCFGTSSASQTCQMSVLFGLVIQTNGFWPKELQPKWKHLLLVASNMVEKQSWGNIAVGAAAGFLMSSTYNARALSGIGPHIQRIFAQRAWGCCGSTVCIWRAHRCRLLGGVLGRLSVGRVGRASPPDLFLGSGVL